MAKIILEFDTDNPDDRDDSDVVLAAHKLFSVLWDFDQYLRSQVNYNDKLSSEANEALEGARTELWDIMNARGLSHLF